MPAASQELNRQAAVWAERGHRIAPATLDRLRASLTDGAGLGGAATRERVPFILVVPAAVRPAAEAMARTDLGGRTGSVNQHAGDLDEFAPIEAVTVPRDEYLLIDVERGSQYRGTAPEPALATLAARGRTPLTVGEGIAILTLRPDVLEKNHCFSLAGSRKQDRRVPAIWISNGAPHLGWCFAGAPHSWLGVASAAGRTGPDDIWA